MHRLNFTYFCIFLLILAGFGILPTQGHADEAVQQKKMEKFHTTGLPLPRFVSLADKKTHVRAGPGEKYPIKLVIERQGLPVEVILEFENWRKIKDFEGQEGWVFHRLLSGERTGLVKSDTKVPVFEKPYEEINEDSYKTMYLEPMVVIHLDTCEMGWCKVSASGFSGWMQRKFIWGVYESENFD